MEGGVPVKVLGGVNSTQYALMVQPLSPHTGVVDGGGGGGGAETVPALATEKLLTTKLDPEEEQGTEPHVEEPSSQDILPVHTLQTGTIPV